VERPAELIQTCDSADASGGEETPGFSAGAVPVGLDRTSISAIGFAHAGVFPVGKRHGLGRGAGWPRGGAGADGAGARAEWSLAEPLQSHGGGPDPSGRPSGRPGGGAKLYRIGELVSYCGLSRQTVHNYSIMGLLREARWTPGGHRLYDESAFERLDRIIAMKADGMSIQEIREHFARVDERQKGPAGDAGKLDAPS
jgi:hypothetical protein